MFTKGPWRIDALNNIWSEDTDICKMSLINEHADEYRDKSFEEHRANIHLIAAAPDLYEALKHLVEYIDKEGPAAKEWKAITEWCEKGEQAILKAEGKS